MGNLSKIDLTEEITKGYIKQKVKTDLLITRPDLHGKVTDKIIVKCLIYISGYIKCMKYHSLQPINTVEVNELLIQECMDWIVEYVEKGGR